MDTIKGHHELFVVVDCGALDDPANGMVTVPATIFNSTASYSCNTGSTLTGDDTTRTCLGSGLWSGSTPTCEGKHKQQV